MDKEKHFTINQLREITGWSYPTALNFVKANGEQYDGWRWSVPASVVRDLVDKDLDAAIEQKSRYYHLLPVSMRV